jgi:mannosyltransferase
MHRLTWSIFIFSILFSVNSLFLYWSNTKPISGDDVWAATSVLGNPLEVIIFTLRWDLHPPLYYLFLDVWSFVSQSDFWLSISSCFIHALTTVLAFNYVHKRHGLLAAFITGIFVFTSPLMFDQSTKLRMYSLLAFLSMSLFYLIEKYESTNKKNYLLSIFLVATALIYSHGIGIILLFFHFCYGCWLFLGRFERLKVWVATHALLFIIAIPLLANSAIRAVSHTQLPTSSDVFHLFLNLFISGAELLEDNAALSQAQIVIMATLLAMQCLLMFFAFRDKTTRTLLICYLVLPLILYALISYLLKPMWLERNFIFALPLISMVFGLTLAKLAIPNWLKITMAASVLVFNITNSAVYKNDFPIEHLIEEVITQVHAEIKPNKQICVIAMNPMNTFWTLQRYLNKVEWGNPTEIQPPLGERWIEIKKKLPEQLVDLLKLNPTPNVTGNDKIVISSGYSENCNLQTISTTLYVTEEKFELPNEINSKLIFKNSYYKVYKSESVINH